MKNLKIKNLDEIYPAKLAISLVSMSTSYFSKYFLKNRSFFVII